jgi:phage shock protein PspC (stress-responsive transcriptional regulator)
MFRSWTDRLLGGVCGGLAQNSPLNAWVWRILFVLLTVITTGVGAVVYVLWWWVLPFSAPNGTKNSSFWQTIVALILGVLCIVGYVLRDTLTAPNGSPIFVLLLLLLMALVFLGKQWATRRYRGNMVWGLVAVAIPVIGLLDAWGVLPLGLMDLLIRALGGVLVFAGLSIFLRDRVRFGTVLALLLTVGLVGALAVFAFSSRTTQQRTENQIINTYRVAETITTLQVNLTSLDTDVQVFSGAPNTREIVFTFLGSPSAQVAQSYSEDGEIATFTLTEQRPQGLPRLDSVGRGTLSVEIPPQLAVAIAFMGSQGDVNFDLDALNLERLNMELLQGDAIVSLPNYQPLSPSVAQNPGVLNVLNGNLRVVIAPDVGGKFLLNKSSNTRPQFDDILYALEDNLSEWLLTSRQYDSATVKILVVVNVPLGQIRLDTQAESGG